MHPNIENICPYGGGQLGPFWVGLIENLISVTGGGQLGPFWVGLIENLISVTGGGQLGPFWVGLNDRHRENYFQWLDFIHEETNTCNTIPNQTAYVHGDLACYQNHVGDDDDDDDDDDADDDDDKAKDQDTD
ncbi:hypothetical protein RRG08_042061 [Elysia crispata]|uniref:Uncharacterized protein n=1 Tax=Elysia crispata TaxID=231223 RepID=A0AAE1CJ54_9GAST|nr:hypothetical protein RRG08_042061 [Elysia crispata]